MNAMKILLGKVSCFEIEGLSCPFLQGKILLLVGSVQTGLSWALSSLPSGSHQQVVLTWLK